MCCYGRARCFSFYLGLLPNTHHILAPQQGVTGPSMCKHESPSRPVLHGKTEMVVGIYVHTTTRQPEIPLSYILTSLGVG